MNRDGDDDKQDRGLRVTLRKARDDANDLRTFFEARNDPVSRKFSRQTEPIDYDSHKKWYSEAINDRETHLFVIQQGGEPVGYCRVEGASNEVSIALLPGFRGIGIGSKALQLVLRPFRGEELKAVIGVDNIASKSAFANAGFTLTRSDGSWETWTRRAIKTREPRDDTRKPKRNAKRANPAKHRSLA
jgi:L-amino acid N-acyltransferase YncA